MNVSNEVSEQFIGSLRDVSLRSLAGKFTVSHLYTRTGQTFVPNVPVFVKSIAAERTYAGFTEFLNPYL